ncbi:hypothetical protein Misp01_28820 [Microtetraspora sp. NBRC 13810]|nr:hypothetical protein Misp01_28820 [Microtetraspora sp. NBRC 13810]
MNQDVTQLEWSAYYQRSPRCRVLDQVSFSEGVELVLIAEGGQWAARRTTSVGFRVVRREETARGIPRRKREAWDWLTGRNVE